MSKEMKRDKKRKKESDTGWMLALELEKEEINWKGFLSFPVFFLLRRND